MSAFGQLIALGPWLVPVLFIIFIALAVLAWWLIDTALTQRRYWRLAPGLAIAGYLTAVALAAVRIIS